MLRRNQRTQQVFIVRNHVNYTYNNIGQLKTARGFEPGGTPRLHEQFGYGYDQAWKLKYFWAWQRSGPTRQRHQVRFRFAGIPFERRGQNACCGEFWGFIYGAGHYAWHGRSERWVPLI